MDEKAVEKSGGGFGVNDGATLVPLLWYVTQQCDRKNA
jgi:hypothetical protein